MNIENITLHKCLELHKYTKKCYWNQFLKSRVKMFTPMQKKTWPMGISFWCLNLTWIITYKFSIRIFIVLFVGKWMRWVLNNGYFLDKLLLHFKLLWIWYSSFLFKTWLIQHATESMIVGLMHRISCIFKVDLY